MMTKGRHIPTAHTSKMQRHKRQQPQQASPPPPPTEQVPAIKTWPLIRKLKLERDFATIQCPSHLVSIGDLRKAFVHRDACRWILFVYGPRREERIVARSSIVVPDEVEHEGVRVEDRQVDIDQLPVDDRSFLEGVMLSSSTQVAAGQWWSDAPTTIESMDTYTRAATEFLRDLVSACPLGVINRAGLWITMRAIASTGCALVGVSVRFILMHSDDLLMEDFLSRFHAALLNDLRHGAHRFSSIVTDEMAAIPDAPKGVIVSINTERPLVTQALRTMFPTDSVFGALPLESIDIVAALIETRQLFIQAGWLMAPLRLLRPYMLANRTMRALREVCKGWLAAAEAAGGGGKHPTLRAVGLEAKLLFQNHLLRAICVKAQNALHTTGEVAVKEKLRPPACARQYLVKAERGDHDAKLVFNARWGMLRLLRSLGYSRFEVERAFISQKGMPVWYSSASQQTSMTKERKFTLNSVFRKPMSGAHASCRTFLMYGLCPFQGDMGACCTEHTGALPSTMQGLWNPLHVAELGRAHVDVVAAGDEAVVAAPTVSQVLLDNLYVVPSPPARLHHASVSRL